jgi:hypothetical protein
MKQFLLVLAAVSGAAAFGQHLTHPGSDLFGASEGTEITPSRQSLTTRPEAILWSYDFANGIPTNWLHSGLANGIVDPDARFEYRGVLTTPDTNVGTRGAFKGTLKAIQSPTKNNGFVIFDSDYLDNLGLSNNNGNGPAPAPQWCVLGPPMFDFSSQPNVQLEFVNYYRRRQGTANLSTAISATWVDFSTDGGQTWPHSVEINTHIGNNQSTTRNHPILINCSNFIGGHDSAQFRLRFDGRYYFWMVDDLQLVNPEPHRLLFVRKGGAPETDILHNTEGKYMQMAVGREQSLTFDANVLNFGVQPQTNVRLKMSLLDPSGNVVATRLSSPTATLAAGDTLDYNDLNTYNAPFQPQSGVGTYKIVYQALSDSTVETADTLLLYVTPQVQALDGKVFSNSLGTESLGDGGGMAVRLELTPAVPNQAEWLKGVEVGLSNLTTGGILELAVYDTSAWGGYTTGFDNNLMLYYAYDSITAADIAAGYKWLGDTAAGINLRAANPSGSYWVVVSMLTNNGAKLIRIKNDQTISHVGDKLMYNTSSARWFTGYSNSRTFNAPWIRARLCHAPNACNIGLDENPVLPWTLAPNPAQSTLRIDARLAHEPVALTITDAAGRALGTWTAAPGTSLDIPVHHWARGMYWVHSQDGTVQAALLD